MTLQERMRELRKERKETQRQVADAIGVTDRQYQRFETGVNLPGFENLVGIADHFGVSLDYLAGRSDRRRCRAVSRRSENPLLQKSVQPFHKAGHLQMLLYKQLRSCL